MNTSLDVSALPVQRLYGPGRRQTNLPSTVLDLKPVIDIWARDGVVKRTPNFGFAMANPLADSRVDWDDPVKLTWFVVGWGPERERYIANALRKLRAAAREGRDTLGLHRLSPMRFRDIVESRDPDSSFAWGDFPWGGAVYVDFPGLPVPLLGAVSALTQEEDHAVAAVILNLIGLRMLKTDELMS